MKSIHFKSENQTWETPQDFFDHVNYLFNFTLDACASADNHKVSAYFSEEDDALIQNWHGVVWCNPPYGRHQVDFIFGDSKDAAPFPSALVVFGNKKDLSSFGKCFGSDNHA